MNLFLISMGLSIVGGFGAIILIRSENASKMFACIFGVAAAVLALIAGIWGLIAPLGPITYVTPFFFASFTLMINPLSGLLLVVINVLALLAWIYGIGYMKEYLGKGVGVIGLFMNLFIMAMNMVVCIDNVFWFLVFFELMSLLSYFLVIIGQDAKSTKAGFLYLVTAHVGFIMIMIGFFIMASITGSLNFESFRSTNFGASTASLVFVLCFLGFGCKAGMFPFHSWLPQAHPAAPSHVSALMSGGMIKIGIFGIVKVAFDLLGASGCELWWGILVVVIGAISAVLGIVYAIAENDIKRLLAYCSVENIGIILLGVGVSLIGVALHMPIVAGLGLLAALYHLLSHGMIKGLLFLGAGSVQFGAHTRDMSKMGGLIKAMPLTALCFLIGALAISALPPLNGFVSEWFTFQSMFSAAIAGGVVIKAVLAFAVVALCITGALAVTGFVKAFGISFLGAARSDHARKALESPISMRIGMVVLAACCILLGVCAPWVTPVIGDISASVLGASNVAAATGMSLVNPDLGGSISLPLIAILLIALIAVPIIIRAVFSKGGRDATKDPWACGYLPDASMPMISSSFEAPVAMFLKPLYTARTALVATSDRFVAAFNGLVSGAGKAETVGDRYVVDSVAVFTDWLSSKLLKIEEVNFRVHTSYIVVALVIFLVLAIVL